MDIDNYICNRCYEEWNFYPEDYDWEEDEYPTRCPLCEMPIFQMVTDVWEKERFGGIKFILKMIWLRIKNE